MCVCVCVCVQKVYCGKTAERIRIPFGMVSGVSQGMGVLDGVGDHRRERGSFGVSHCNQWGLCDAHFSNYFEDLLHYELTKGEVCKNDEAISQLRNWKIKCPLALASAFGLWRKH